MTRRLIRLLFYSVFAFAASFAIVRYDLVSYDYFIETEFLFTFLGVFIGFALTLYTYVISMFEKMESVLKDMYSDKPEELTKRIGSFNDLHAEIKNNIKFLLYALIIVVLLSIGDKLIISLNGCWDGTIAIAKSLLLTIFILSVVSLIDLMGVSFAISDFVINKGNNE